MTWRDEIARRVRGEHLRDAPLAPRTAVRVGGPADLLCRPADGDALSALLGAVRELGVPLSVLGGGANTLVADAGVRGVVLRLPQDFPGESTDGDTLVLSAGAPIARLPARAHAHGLVGMEFLGGIPGTLGGAAAMNAGTRLGEMKDVVTRLELATADGAGFVPAAALGYAYRTCRLPPGAVVARVEVRLRPGDVAASEALMREDRERRRATQPLDRPTFGSTFTNPPGEYAGRLIEAVGLKGHRVGGAVWSPVHANFVTNLGGATARDVLALIRLARARVKERFGIALETEVRLMGEFPPDELAGLDGHAADGGGPGAASGGARPREAT
ncbi:UDP-N-acetylmuramate dehydrogenase [Anaeromyxobacter dehalogenans]|uniref:UDP-N-acetylenolpyruvoylglucosamine reductase n=1 Tax=Anaeromyxobacter dehalogenans (strain 2CP-C) TaxID=290397 RepID=MURB_ANADE|nr:UDP-N-acetylmuramate dehydrogenase [Anaeromyxobacter dehalogenans]Q2IG34.1 RecName: Full=UDP-N-acetylenolpyruvoylglucosamine reductase; AltName: Full=UDP-N-acetylmuramate dehydrogenase [Anaeromyxobacter dehalogenans 2CP-C]ABC83539.1 UDP-N-acetylmuramate dehydrogenase [Anaeromyxobacter dehalogenans 2CP-C]